MDILDDVRRLFAKFEKEGDLDAFNKAMELIEEILDSGNDA